MIFCKTDELIGDRVLHLHWREVRMWNRDEVRGKVGRVKGRVKEEVGDLIDNEQLEDEGRAQRAAGEVEEGFGRGRRQNRQRHQGPR